MAKLQRLVDSNTATTVIVYKLCRLARNVRTTLDFVEAVAKRGISFVSLLDQIDTGSAMGKFQLLMLAGINQLYRDQQSERMRDVRAHQKANGLFGGGLIPFGFRREGDKLTPCPYEVEVVDYIKHLRSVGCSLRDIASQLEHHGYLTRTGNDTWHPQVISDVVNS